ncbi:MAG: dihydropteroate synthase [Candidatus Hydrogenedentes bacterium]|nr:dihydropteroate synthase [Candidatus Hydrogenedentota bacterium]
MRNRTLVMGVLNVTPDSFFDGGLYLSPDKAYLRAMQMIEEGCDVIDIGGESSRPGAVPIGADEEKRRILPVLEALQGISISLSVDTYRAETARIALKYGVSMVNDISAFRLDPDLVEVVAEAGCQYVLMHMQGTPQTMQINPRYEDVVSDICYFFEERLKFATEHGVKEEKVWLDPGFGFGKTVEQNLTLLRRIKEFFQFGRPVLVGTSNKSTIGAVLNLPVEERLEGTSATVAWAVFQGVHGVRVHNVKEMVRVVRMSEAIMYGVKG